MMAEMAWTRELEVRWVEYSPTGENGLVVAGLLDGRLRLKSRPEKEQYVDFYPRGKFYRRPVFPGQVVVVYPGIPGAEPRIFDSIEEFWEFHDQ